MRFWNADVPFLVGATDTDQKLTGISEYNFIVYSQPYQPITYSLTISHNFLNALPIQIGMFLKNNNIGNFHIFFNSTDYDHEIKLSGDDFTEFCYMINAYCDELSEHLGRS